MAHEALSIPEHAIAARTKRRAYFFPLQLMEDWLWSIHKAVSRKASLTERLNYITTSIVLWVGIQYGLQAAYMVFIAIMLGTLFDSLPNIPPEYYMIGVFGVVYALIHALLRFVKVLPAYSGTSMKRFLFVIPAAFGTGALMQCVIFFANQLLGVEERVTFIVLLAVGAIAGIVRLKNYLTLED
jgi:hypothetical protein